MTTQNEEKTQEGAEKLYANKFKTVEELEAGYKNSLPTFQENETLKKQLSDLTAVPQTYMNPTDVEVDPNRVADIQARAREAGMNQAQYEKFVRGDKARVEANRQRLEDAKKEVGEETLNILKDYATKNYPKELVDGMISTFVQNKDARQAALNHRDQLLNNNIPGLNKNMPPVGFTVTDADIKKAYEAKERNRGDMKAREHYLRLVDQYAQQKTG